jgi:hypothetical protein
MDSWGKTMGQIRGTEVADLNLCGTSLSLKQGREAGSFQLGAK